MKKSRLITSHSNAHLAKQSRKMLHFKHRQFQKKDEKNSDNEFVKALDCNHMRTTCT